jgi:hypothetical protein
MAIGVMITLRSVEAIGTSTRGGAPPAADGDHGTVIW